jgi:hypothetical protein
MNTRCAAEGYKVFLATLILLVAQCNLRKLFQRANQIAKIVPEYGHRGFPFRFLSPQKLGMVAEPRAMDTRQTSEKLQVAVTECAPT